MEPEQFGDLRERAEEMLAERIKSRAWWAKFRARPEGPTRWTLKDLGLVVTRPSDDLMARKMILAGLVIEEVLPEGRESPFRKGDIVLTCRNMDEIALDRPQFDRDAPRSASLLRHFDGKPLTVLRGGEISFVNLLGRR